MRDFSLASIIETMSIRTMDGIVFRENRDRQHKKDYIECL